MLQRTKEDTSQHSVSGNVNENDNNDDDGGQSTISSTSSCSLSEDEWEERIWASARSHYCALGNIYSSTVGALAHDKDEEGTSTMGSDDSAVTVNQDTRQDRCFIYHIAIQTKYNSVTFEKDFTLIQLEEASSIPPFEMDMDGLSNS